MLPNSQRDSTGTQSLDLTGVLVWPWIKLSLLLELWVSWIWFGQALTLLVHYRQFRGGKRCGRGNDGSDSSDITTMRQYPKA